MKLTVKQLITAIDALKRLGEKGIKILPYKMMRAVSRNITVIDQEIDKYNKDFQKVVAGFSAEQPDGVYGIAPKDVLAFNLIIEEAQAVEVDIPIMTIALTEEIIEKADIHAADLSTLDWMFEFPEEK